MVKIVAFALNSYSVFSIFSEKTWGRGCLSDDLLSGRQGVTDSLFDIGSKLGDDFGNKIRIVTLWWWSWSGCGFWSWFRSHLDKVFLYLSSFCVSVGIISGIFNYDKGSMGINIAILSCDSTSISVFVMGNVCLFFFIGDLVFVGVLRVWLFLDKIRK